MSIDGMAVTLRGDYAATLLDADGDGAALAWLRSVERMRPRPGRACAGPTCCALVYDIDMRTCPNCGQGRLEPIATILDPDVFARILAAMDRFARAPPA